MSKAYLLLFFWSKLVLADWFPALQPDIFISDLKVMNEAGEHFNLADQLKAIQTQTFLLLPIFTRCQTSCPLLVESLMHALSTLPGNPAIQWIILSFDVSESPDDLKRFRHQRSLPPSWMLLRADHSQEVRSYFDRFDYQIMNDNGGFNHPNQLFVFDHTQRWVGSLYTNTNKNKNANATFTSEDLKTALNHTPLSSGWLHQIQMTLQHPEKLAILGAIGLVLAILVICFILF